MKWAYGVTTVPMRAKDLLPKTLASLAAGGFDKPRLFVDGTKDANWYECKFGLEVTGRWPAVRTAGNWVLSMYELYYREPAAERYALFQDDLLCVKNLRAYLERVPPPEQGYQNLYLFPQNLLKLPTGGLLGGWYPSIGQNGLGAVGLVFTLKAVQTLLQSKHLVERVTDVKRGWRAIDGGIVDSMRKAGWKEYVHQPSLLQHTGVLSATRNSPHPQAETFPGEDFDALSLLVVK